MKRNFFKITALAAAVLLISASVSACASDTLPENGADTAGDTVPAAEESSAGDTIPEEKDYFTLTGAGAESFTVIRPDAVQAEENNENGAFRGAVVIKKRLGEITGSNFPIASDWEKGNPKSVVIDNYEILVGETNRAETVAARAELPVEDPDDERKQALGISAGLKQAKTAFEAGERGVVRLRDIVLKSVLANRGQVQYVEVVNQKNLQKFNGVIREGDKVVILVAAFFGKTRLIDNIELN